MTKRVLLDTGMLVGLMREAPWALKADADLGLSGPETLAFTSAVCRGELLSLAEKWGWGAAKRKQMESVLDRFPTIGINRASILSAYALIDAWTHGKMVDSPGGVPPPKPAVPMSRTTYGLSPPPTQVRPSSCPSTRTSLISTECGSSSSSCRRLPSSDLQPDFRVACGVLQPGVGVLGAAATSGSDLVWSLGQSGLAFQ